MAKQYHTTSLETDVVSLIPLCERLYRDNHKEFDTIPLSKNKILYEVILFYLKGTKYEVKR